MCLAIPSKVLAVDELQAVVERYGEKLVVSLAMLSEPVEVGDYVIVQAQRHAVERMDAATAKQTLELFDEIAETLDFGVDDGDLAPQRRRA